MKKLKRLFAIAMTIAIALTVTACAKSAFDFDEDAAITRAKEVVDVVNTKDYEAIYNAFGENTRALTTADDIKAAFEPIVDPLGAFQEYKSTEAVGIIDKNGTKYIQVFVKTVYDNVTHVYQVTFDTELNLEGFHTKS